MEEQWVPEDQLSIVEKEFVSFLTAKIPPGGYKIDQKSLLGARYKIHGFCRETYTAYECHGCVFYGGPPPSPKCFPMDTE